MATCGCSLDFKFDMSVGFFFVGVTLVVDFFSSATALVELFFAKLAKGFVVEGNFLSLLTGGTDLETEAVAWPGLLV